LRSKKRSIIAPLRQIAKTFGFLCLLSVLLLSERAHAINCRITLFPINFGIYMPLQQTPSEVTGSLNVRCMAQPGSFTVQIGPGTSGNQLARTLVSGDANTLNYNLYENAARTLIWGDGTPPTVTVSGVRSAKGRPSYFTYPVYGRIFANQAPSPGIYNDNILVTILF
jgi:spore coat protein U-like protein